MKGKQTMADSLLTNMKDTLSEDGHTCLHAAKVTGKNVTQV